MTGLTGEELLAWVDRTSQGWQELVAKHPETLSFPCDVRETKSVAEFLQHIVAVELRYAERLHGRTETPYEQIGMDSGEVIFATHDTAMRLYLDLLADNDFAWDEEIDFQTRSAGLLRASRRTVLIHAMMHSIRHYAQLATLVRQHGVKPDWAMDYLFMGARRP
jgi:uncharacterized damage-inducible protein DinB